MALLASREGMFDVLSLGSYLRLVDYTGRLFREGRAAISAELSGETKKATEKGTEKGT
jgi:hypothetical protein